jgi:hypothetical protein
MFLAIDYGLIETGFNPLLDHKRAQLAWLRISPWDNKDMWTVSSLFRNICPHTHTNTNTSTHTLCGVRGGRAVHGATDMCDSQACNQCLCGVWVRFQLAALDMLHRIKGIFGADHVPVVSSGHSGFLHHWKGPIPPMSWVGATLLLPCSPRGE